jgi:Ca2+-binding EF-hand superfamily protein
MKKTFVILLTVCALALTATVALAAENKIPAFEQLDVDRNGSISTEEASSCEALMDCFVKADADHDGQLTLAEYATIETGMEEEG